MSRIDFTTPPQVEYHQTIQLSGSLHFSEAYQSIAPLVMVPCSLSLINRGQLYDPTYRVARAVHFWGLELELELTRGGRRLGLSMTPF